VPQFLIAGFILSEEDKWKYLNSIFLLPNYILLSLTFFILSELFYLFIMIIEKNGFIHHVFFWLKNPERKEDAFQLIEGLKKLSAAPTIKDFHIGIPAATNREVIDNSYAVSWLLLFKNKEDQDIYQTDPMHLKFIEECSHLWNKVIVYDTIDGNVE
jgi:hypothetical protein